MLPAHLLRRAAGTAAWRLDDPTKHWKFRERDIDERALWQAYMAAYDEAIARCSDAAPWFVVPANHKWYRNWAVATLLQRHWSGSTPATADRPGRCGSEAASGAAQLAFTP
jgi:hypothetical protein